MTRYTRKEWVKHFVKEGPTRENRFMRLMQSVEQDVQKRDTQLYSSQEVLGLLQFILEGGENDGKEQGEEADQGAEEAHQCGGLTFAELLGPV